MGSLLVKGGSAHKGHYVVTDGPHSQKIVAASSDPATALEKACELGASDPVLVYVPTDDEHTIVL